jgi:3-hydroxyacyl-CoA dehydrogenase
LNTGALVRAVEAALTLPFEQGLAIEREEFLKLILPTKPWRCAMSSLPNALGANTGDRKGVLPRTITRVAVIGAGTMGGGIAMTFANAGLSVRLIETSQALLDKGIERIRGDYAVSVKRGSMTQAALDGAMALIEGAVDLDVIAGADLIVEAAFEDMAVKRQIFGQIGRIAAPGAILATNTSYLDVNEIASASGRPADVLGLHFFSPANVMRLLEVVRGQATAPDVLATGVDLGRRLGKLPVVSGVCFGFIGNRMLAQRTRAAERLLLAGMSPADVDAAITGFGFRMGQFAMLDLAGIDIGWRTRKAFGGFAPVGDRLAEMGRFGQKTGRGYYLYPEGARKGVPDPDVTRIIADEAAVRGVAAESLSGDQLIERLFYPMVNEGARILDEGIAYRAADIDLVWINGYGWPNWMGGPMFWADGIGLSRIVESLEAQAARLNAPEIEPSSLLRRLAAEGRGWIADRIKGG